MRQKHGMNERANLFRLVTFTLFLLAAVSAEHGELADLKIQLPTVDANTTRRYWDDGPVEFDHCSLQQKRSPCSSQFAASQTECQGLISFHSLLKHFFPNEDIATLTNGFIQPEKFDCTKFYINTCKEQLEFQARAREDIDLIPNRLRVSEANLIFRLMYRLHSLYYAAMSIEMDGFVHMGSKKVAITCSKGLSDLPINITIDEKQVSTSEFAELFLVNDFTALDLPPAVEELKTLTLHSVSIQGYYFIDGYFEFFLKGKPDTSTVFIRSLLYMVIQKHNNDRIIAGVTALFSSVSFQEILSGVIGKDIFYKIPILWYGKLNIALQTSANGILKVKDEAFNRDFRFFVTRGMAIAKGLSISVEFPFQEYANAVSTSIKEKNLPLRFLFTGKISQKKIVILFNTELIITLKSSFLILMSQSEASILARAFMDQQALCTVTKMDLIFTTSEITVYLTFQRSMSIVQGLPQISQFQISLKKTLKEKWKISGHGHGQIAGIEFETAMENNGGNSYSLLAKAETLSSSSLVENFAKDTGLVEIVKKLEFFNFEISKVFAKSRMNAELNFRLTGVPNIFEYATSQYAEAVLYNNSRNIPGFAFGIILKDVRFEELLVKLFGSQQQREAWLQRVDCAIILSSGNENKGDESLRFTFTELNELTLKRGLNIGIKIYFPTHCGGDGLCDFLNSYFASRGSVGVMVKGNLSQSEMTCEWKTTDIIVSRNLQLHNVVFRIFGGYIIRKILIATFEFKLYNFAMKGTISADKATGILLELSMESQWNNPFSVESCIFSQLHYKDSINSLTTLEYFEATAILYLGTVHIKQRITSTAKITISTTDLQQSYFYSNLASLDLKSLLEAYGIHNQTPMILQSAMINGAAIASYSNNPLPVTVEDLNLKIENRLTIQGMVSVFGYLGKFEFSLTSLFLQLTIRLPRLHFSEELVRIVSSCDCSNIQKFDGPLIVATFMESRTEVTMFGVVKCLGISKQTNITIDDSGYAFNISGLLFGLFESDFRLEAAYGKPSETTFVVKSCIPSALPNVTYELIQQLKYISNNTKDLLHKTKRKVTDLEMILQQSHKRVDIHKEESDSYESKIEEEIEILKKMRNHLNTRCTNDCNDVCMGAPSWINNAIPFESDFVGSPQWNNCKHEIPDIVCVAQCLGRSVIRNVKAFNKQKLLQRLVASYQHSMERERQSKRFLQKTVYQVGSIISKLENANDQMTLGLEMARSLAGKSISEIVNLDKVCMQGFIDDVVHSEVEFTVEGVIAGKRIDSKVNAKMEKGLWKVLAAKLLDSTFSNASLFAKTIEEVKSMLSEAEKQKRDILTELRDKIYITDIGDASKKDFITSEENFKRFAYAELPRYTLGNDDIIKLFTKESPWVLIQSNDPLENAFISNGTRRMLQPKTTSYKDHNQARDKDSRKPSCLSIYESLKKYKDIIRVASSIAENFFKEKVSYLKSKNKKFAALRDIEDQIKSQCYIENCTVGELNDALKYAGKTKDGLLKWMEKMKDQILKHDRTSLQVLTENIAAIIEKEHNVKLSRFITSVADDLSSSYKRTIKVTEQSMDLSFLEQMDLDVRNLLLNSRGRRLTHTAPLIFSMKRRFQRMSKSMLNDCLKRRRNRELMKQEENT